MDYTIGISLFLVVVLGVLTFLPTAFETVDGDASGNPSDRVTAGRVADYLVETAFADHRQSDRLRSDCVRNFFEGGVGCPYFGAGSTLAGKVGLSESRPLNVTIKAEVAVLGGENMETLCWDATGDGDGSVGLTPKRSGDCTTTDDTILAAGPSPAANENYETARRFGRLAGEEVHVVVRTW